MKKTMLLPILLMSLLYSEIPDMAQMLRTNSGIDEVINGVTSAEALRGPDGGCPSRTRRNQRGGVPETKDGQR